MIWVEDIHMYAPADTVMRKFLLSNSPAYSTFFTVVRIPVDTGEVSTDFTEISRHHGPTATTLSTVFTNLK